MVDKNESAVRLTSKLLQSIDNNNNNMIMTNRARQNHVGAVEMSSVSSRVRESLVELHAHVDFVFRDTNTLSRQSHNSSSLSKKTKFELEKLRLSTQNNNIGSLLSQTNSRIRSDLSLLNSNRKAATTLS